MPPCGRLKVSELRKLCDERGLQHAVINKVYTLDQGMMMMVIMVMVWKV